MLSANSVMRISMAKAGLKTSERRPSGIARRRTRAMLWAQTCSRQVPMITTPGRLAKLRGGCEVVSQGGRAGATVAAAQVSASCYNNEHGPLLSKITGGSEVVSEGG